MTKARDIASAIPAPSTVSSAELGYLDGVTSAIQTQVDAKTAKATLTTTGDIYYASAANTPARLGIGSSAQVLTVAAGVPSWATASSGGMTLLSTTTLSGATVTISSIDQTYKNLHLVIFGVTNATGQGRFSISGFGGTVYFTNNGPTSSTLNDNSGNLELSGFGSSGPDNADSANIWSGTIDNYASTTARKSFSFYGEFPSNRNSRGFFCAGGINSTDAISSLTFSNTAGSLSTGTVLLYGVK